MFSKNANLLLPQVCHSLSNNPVINSLNNAEILLHHHQDMLCGNNYLATNAPVLDTATLFNQDVGGRQDGDLDPSSLMNTCTRKHKKDRHSKIQTAQGPRDRRVRLSIGIARKFFDLQEMLGFDKPSKTLDWLLTKSKTAIKDLVQTKQNGNKSVSSSSPSPSDYSGGNNGEILEYGKSFGADTKRKLNSNKHKGAQDPYKESRVKARARARERTREKMCIKQMNESRNSGYDLNPSSIPIQYMNNQLEVCKISGCNSNNSSSSYNCPGPTTYEPAASLIQESFVIRRKTKNPSIFEFQQNLIVSSANNNFPSPYIENWDISSITSQSSLCALLDQHKFINCSSNN